MYARNVASIALARGSAILLDGLAYVLIARYLGPSDYGFYISIAAAITLIDLASDLSVFDIVVRESSRQLERAGAWLGASSALRALLGGAGMVVFLAYALFGPPSHHAQVRTAALLGAVALPIGSLRMPLALFRAEMRMEYEFILLAVTRLVNLLLVLAFISLHYGLLQLILAIVLSRSFLAVSAWTICVRVFRVRPRFDWQDFRRLVVECIPMAISGLFVAVQLKVDLLLVTAISGAEQGGLYAVVGQLPEYLLYVPVIVTTPLLPLLSRAFGDGQRAEFAKLFDKLMTGLAFVAVPAVIVSFFRAHDLVVLVFGNKFAPTAQYFPWIILSVAFMWISHGLAVATVATGLQKNFIWIQSICVVAFLAVCVRGIPHWGPWGATLARLIGTFLAPVLTWFVLRRASLSFRLNMLVPAGLAAITMAAILALTRGLPVYLALAAALGGYLAILGSAQMIKLRSEVAR